MNKTTSKQLLLLSLSKTLADLLTELECATDRSVLIKASECKFSVPTSIYQLSDIHSSICPEAFWLKLHHRTLHHWRWTTWQAATTGGSDIVVLLKLYAVGATKIDSFLDLTFTTLIFFFFFVATRQTHGPKKSVKQINWCDLKSGPIN